MDRPTRVFVAMLVIAGLAVLAFFAFGPPAERTFASPQECFEAARKAARKDDARSFCQTLTEGGQDLFVAKLILFIYATQEEFEQGGNEDKKAVARTLEKIAAKHGLTSEFLKSMHADARILIQGKPAEKGVIARALTERIGNKAAFAGEIYPLIVKVAPPFFQPLEEWKDSELARVNITGDVVQAMRTTGAGRPAPIVFRKHGDGWRIDTVEAEGPMMHP